MSATFTLRHTKKILPVPLLSALTILVISLPAHADVVYNFGHVADVTQESYPAINDNGLVAFEGSIPNVGNGVFTAKSGPPTSIGGASNGTAAVWVNDAGQVAFRNNPSLGVFTAARGSGGPLTTISPANGVVNPLCVVSDNGTVAYLSEPTGIAGPTSITVASGTGGAITTIYSSTSVSSTQYSDAFEGLAISHNGILAYEKYPSTGGDFIIINHGGSEITAASVSGLNSISINNAGIVLFNGAVGGLNNFGLYEGDGTTLTELFPSTTAFAALGNASINNLGQYAFLGDGNTGAANGFFKGIYSGNNPAHNKIIQVGDALNGSTVTDLLMGTDAINDSGEVVFWAQLANGTSGIYTATAVPEPASLAMLAIGGVWLASRRRARSKIS